MKGIVEIFKKVNIGDSSSVNFDWDEDVVPVCKKKWMNGKC